MGKEDDMELHKKCFKLIEKCTNEKKELYIKRGSSSQKFTS